MNVALELEQLGYAYGRELPNGERIGLMRFVFTVGLVVGIDERGDYRTRFCYPNPADALAAVLTWDGEGDPPGPWVKEKGRGCERCNPALCEAKG